MEASPSRSLAASAALCLLALTACGDAAPAHESASVDRPPHPTMAHPEGASDATSAADADVATAPTDATTAPTDATTTTPTDATTGTDATTDTSEPDTTVAPTPPPEVPQLTASELDAVHADLAAALLEPGLAGRTFGGLVVDLDTDQTIWDSDADRTLIPASNTKVFTTACAIDRLGEDHRITTRVTSAATIDQAGTLSGDLDLYSEHDFFCSRWFYADERHPFDRLADMLYRKGLRKVSGHLGISGAYLYDGYHFGSYDPATQRGRVATAFTAALAAKGITVTQGVADHATMTPPAGQELARWVSLPLHVGAWAINRVSHNEMADILSRHLGWVLGGSSDFETGGEVVRDWLASTGTDVTGFEVHDGSGLDVGNQVSARHLVGVYRHMTKSSTWPAWKDTLSVGGGQGPGSVDDNGEAIVTTNSAPYNGTLGYRMTDPDTAGRVFGKSGTNAGITTSGVLVNRYDGHLYAFAFLMNDLPSGTANLARATQDALVAAFAGDLRGRGARPAAPTLGCVRGRPGGGLEVALAPQDDLAPADGVAGFRVQTSADGKTWSLADSTFTLATSLVVPAAAGATVYVRAFAENTAGRSDPSDVYAARVVAGASVPRALLVDGDDRWQRQPVNENPMGAAHRFMADYAAAMPAGIAFDTCPNEAITDESVTLAAYDAVVWDAAEESTTDESLSSAEESALAAYLGLGGALFVSGAELAWDLDPAGNSTTATAADETFYQTWLRASYAGDDADTYVAEGVPGSIFAGLVDENRLGFWTPGEIFVAYPDELQPLGGASACLTYDGPGTTACVQFAGDYDLVSLGFPFESIDGAAERAEVMRRVMVFFGLAGG